MFSYTFEQTSGVRSVLIPVSQRNEQRPAILPDQMSPIDKSDNTGTLLSPGHLLPAE